ncbi:hypothetical protein K2X85_16395 [bacterium]|nr:hypothetical protein [bacterium]
MRWIGLMFVAMCVIVPVGFYYQAHGNFRGRSKLEAWPELRYQEGANVVPDRPVAVCSSRALCAETRRMTRRLREAETRGKAKDIQVAREWFRQLHADLVWADEILVLHADPRYTEVRVTRGQEVGFQGFVYTVGLEEDAPAAKPAATYRK